MSRGALLRSTRPLLAVAAVVTFAAAWLPLLPALAPLATLEAFAQLAQPRVAGLFGRSLLMGVAAAGLATLVGLPLALLASRTRLPGAAVFGLLLPLPLLLPPLLLAQAWHGLTGMDGIHAAWFSLGLSYAPFPALFAARALGRQNASSSEAALLSGGPRLAFGEMLRIAWPAAALGAAFAFLFAVTDFAVPDYFAAVGDKFAVYSAEVFNAFRFQELAKGAASAAPLILVAVIVFVAALGFAGRRVPLRTDRGRTPPDIDPGAGRWPGFAVAFALTSLMLLLPLGRILYETGMAGPLGEGSWLSRSKAAFGDAVERGRMDLLRSLRTGLLAGLLVAAVAPVWAHWLVRSGAGWLRRLLVVALALPLLAPAVGFGLGAILVFNRGLFHDFYDGPWLPPLVLAGRFLPIAVFLLAERLQQAPREPEDAARIAGASYPARLYRYVLGPQRAAWLLAAALVAVFAVRELDLAILLPGANQSAAVRYYNALHFARDNFIAAFGIVLALVLFLPVMIHGAWRGLRGEPTA